MNLTLNQSIQRFGERFINNRGLHEAHGQVEIQSGIGELHCDTFDTSVDWSSATPRLGDNGQIVASGSGPALNATVIAVPSADNPFLGLRFRFTP